MRTLTNLTMAIVTVVWVALAVAEMAARRIGARRG